MSIITTKTIRKKKRLVCSVTLQLIQPFAATFAFIDLECT